MSICIECFIDNIQATIEQMGKLAIKDPKLCFLGKHLDEIIGIFGQPTTDYGEQYEYERCYQGKKFAVTFGCYKYDKQICTEIEIFFYDT